MGKTKLLTNFVTQRVEQWSYTLTHPATRVALAKLRRGLGKKPGTLPDLWEYTLEGLDDELLSHTGNPTYEEWAIYLALTLYAYHQQGQTRSMHKFGASFGDAVRLLATEGSIGKRSEAVTRRMQALVSADSIESIAIHLRSLVGQLRSHVIPLDYVLLAKDLYGLQYEDSKDKITLRWGQDYYKKYAKKMEDENHD